MPVVTKLGIDGKTYRNTGTYGTPVWDEVKNISNLTLALETSEADVTTRENGGWEAVVAALHKATIEFQMVADTGDTDWTAIKTAYLAKTGVEFAIMNGDITVAGAQGLRATMAIVKFARNEQNEEAQMFDVTLKPTRADNAPSWHTSV